MVGVLSAICVSSGNHANICSAPRIHNDEQAVERVTANRHPSFLILRIFVRYRDCGTVLENRDGVRKLYVVLRRV